jgi:hypothetical protein
MKHCHRAVNGNLKEMLLTRFLLLLVGPVTSGVKYMVTVAVAYPAAVAISLSCSVQRRWHCLHHGEVAGVVTSEKKNTYNRNRGHISS